MSISQYVPPATPQRRSVPQRDFNAMLPEQYRKPPPAPPVGMDDYVQRYMATHDPITHLPIGPGALPTHVPFADVPRGAQPEYGPTTGFVAPKKLEPGMTVEQPKSVHLLQEGERMTPMTHDQWADAMNSPQYRGMSYGATAAAVNAARRQPPAAVSPSVSTGRSVPDDATVRAEQLAALQSLIPRSR